MAFAQFTFYAGITFVRGVSFTLITTFKSLPLVFPSSEVFNKRIFLPTGIVISYVCLCCIQGCHTLREIRKTQGIFKL